MNTPTASNKRLFLIFRYAVPKQIQDTTIQNQSLSGLGKAGPHEVRGLRAVLA